MPLACEAEIRAMFMDARETILARKTLEKMGHPQPRRPMQTDNSAAQLVVTNNIQPCRMKAIDMRFYWLRCREFGGIFYKNIPGVHHKAIPSQFLTPKNTQKIFGVRKSWQGSA